MSLPISNFYILMVVNICLGVAGQLLIKYGVGRVGGFVLDRAFQFFMQALTSPFVLMGLTLYMMSAFLWLVVLSKVELSVAYPMLSFGYVIILFTSAVFLGEVLTPGKLIGVLLVVGGVIMINR